MTRRYIALAIAVAATLGCSRGELRGKSVPSTDDGTYLVFDDANASACKYLRLDGQRWPHPVHVPGKVRAGTHVVECGGRIEFEVRPRTVFHFDYWGP